jgi:hypothetical protein
MFRALTCPSSGGNIVSTQHLVSSLSVNVCTVHRLRADIARHGDKLVSFYFLQYIYVTSNYRSNKTSDLNETYTWAGMVQSV